MGFTVGFLLLALGTWRYNAPFDAYWALASKPRPATCGSPAHLVAGAFTDEVCYDTYRGRAAEAFVLAFLGAGLLIASSAGLVRSRKHSHDLERTGGRGIETTDTDKRPAA